MSEEWRTVSDCPVYEVSDLGRVRRRETGHVLSPAQGKPIGYLRVSLWRHGKGETRTVHQLVCEAFHGARPSPDMDTAHLNGVPDDNRAENLKWKTRKQNEADKVQHGRANLGERNGQSNLTEKSVREIRARMCRLPRSAGNKRIRKGALSALAAEYGVSTSCLSAIAAGRLWAHVD